MKFPWHTCSRVAEAFKDIFELEPMPDYIDNLKRINREKPMSGECNGCGNPEPERLKVCPRCENEKCSTCDMGDDVECPSCIGDEL